MPPPRIDCRRLEQKVKQAQDNEKNKQSVQLLFWCILRAELDLVSEWVQETTSACLNTFESMDLTPISKLGSLLKQNPRQKSTQPANSLQLFVAFCDELLQVRKCMVDNFLLASQMLESYESVFHDDKARQFILEEMLEAEFIKAPKLLGLLEKARFIALVILQQKEDYNSKGLVKSICAKCSHRMVDPVVLACGDALCTWCLTNHVATTGLAGRLCPVCPALASSPTRYYVPHILQGVLFEEASVPEKTSSLRALRFLNPIEICTSWGAAEVLSQPAPPRPTVVAVQNSVVVPAPNADSFFSQGPVEQEHLSQAPLSRLAMWATSLFSPGLSSSTLKLMEGTKEHDRRERRSSADRLHGPLKSEVSMTGLEGLSLPDLGPTPPDFATLTDLSTPPTYDTVHMEDAETLFCNNKAPLSLPFHISPSSLPLDLFFQTNDTKEPDNPFLSSSSSFPSSSFPSSSPQLAFSLSPHSSFSSSFSSSSSSPFAPSSSSSSSLPSPFASSSLPPDLAIGPKVDDTFSFHDSLSSNSPQQDNDDSTPGTYVCQELSTCLDTHWIKPCLETHGPEEEGVMYFQNEEVGWGEGMCENPAHHMPKLENVVLHDRDPNHLERIPLFPQMGPCLVPSECPVKLVRNPPTSGLPAQHFHIYPHQHAREHEHIKRKHTPSNAPPPKRHDALSSCHQCKCKKLSEDCALCCGAKACRKKFCSTCLKKHYNTTLEQIRLVDSWMCPACSGICLCAACNRDRVNWNQAPKLSCHQCKCNKQPAELTFCASDSNQRKCRKKYCRTCLLQYGNMVARAESSTTWECPACREFCSCATCKRKRDVR